MRFFITELPILPSSELAPITATAFGFMMRFIAVTMSCLRRAMARLLRARSCSTMRTSAAIAPLAVANTGFRSSSEISGKSLTSSLTRTIRLASASRFTGSPPRTPLSISAA